MKKTFWKADWFAGVVVSLLFLFAANSDFLQGLERKAYDFGVQASSHSPGDKVAVIAIDDQSIANIGRWPWSREIHAKMIDILAGAHAKVIGNTVFFIEPQIDPGLAYINKLSQFVAGSSAAPASPDAYQLSQMLTQLGAMLKEAETALNSDRTLAESLKKAGNVVLAMPFSLGEPSGNPDKPLPDYVVKNALGKVTDRVGAESQDLLPLSTLSALPPIPEIGRNAAAIGHLNANPDVDGAIRAEPLVLRHYDQYYPSLSLQIVARYFNLQPKDIQARLGEGVKVGKLNVATDGALQMSTFFYTDREGRPAFPLDSFYDVYTGKIPASKYQNKIVLIGATAVGVGANQVTPISAAMAPVLILAHSVASILNQNFYTSPPWAIWAERGALLLVALYLILLLPRLKAGMGAVISIGLLTALLATHFVLMTQQAMWLQLMVPATLLLVGHVLLTTKRYLLTEQGKAKSDADSAESNRNLGLMFQGQGQLDMAFDRLRKCPMDDSVMDLLYNLGLDFERKRQFNKAESVFNYMAEYNPKYKDLEARTARSKAMSETVMLGGGGRTNASTLILDDGSVEKPMLGRYQLEKELGKGAMGVVYLGKDPKISRVVAIKTMALSQEFEADELDEVKERFFRPAETAGRLNHPNIVTIYDAGEEHELGYIALEFPKAKDLARYTNAENLLPLPKVMDIVAKVADALDYAHGNNVVHRDIKPANIMYEPDSGNVKVTDFGIARITDSSKTKTGMVLGTPSYMSPEQLAGKKVDGRSDLFSLGAMLYQMTTGQLPFQGDSMATLMFKIANEPHPSVLALRPDLPPCLVAIIDRMLEKDMEKRYQHGAEISNDIRQCMGQA
ncbi:MAG: CHASE2 domain-containing protein [Nitrosomonadales bacterium]|nr:MAG: CHASE2 domain-containing protein [Nitrosomonadales bacterium]